MSGTPPSLASVDPLELVDPDRYARRGYPHDVWSVLRQQAPIAWVEPPGFEPFWAVTKHADVRALASQAVVLSSAYGIGLRKGGRSLPPEPPQNDVLVVTDPPRHGPLRRVANPAFTPRAVKARRADMEALVAEVLEAALADAGEEGFDFVHGVAAPFPLAVIATILGVPRSDVGLLFRWSDEVIGKEDAEYQRPGETAAQTLRRARGEIHAYFEDLLDERRRRPGDDLMTKLLAARIDGRPLTAGQLVSYCELLVEAGNETTRNAISGGLLALAERPDQWRRLKSDPGLLPDAVEEILRWVSPISHFSRTATDVLEFGGVTIRPGEQVALYFASANRDEEVFDDPFEFRVDRRPNPHLTFGFGEHFCMGAHLAKLEIEILFRHLLQRVEAFEVVGPVERLRSITNGSIKRLPVRCHPGSA